MKPLFENLLGEATRLTHGGKLAEATAAIQRALRGATVHPYPVAGAAAVLDGLVRELPAAPHEPAARLWPASAEPQDPARAPKGARGIGASFVDDSYTGVSGTRTYKLFVPAGYVGQALPLIVMLHGCTQSPDDFAAGTRMNEVAQERGFLVLYPAQAPRSNQSKCWNWFAPNDQRRGAGEPELLAGMTRHVIETYRVDPARVYVAGLSAGGAMADILGREYPDLYAAVGVHSGLPQGAARDVASAFSAMNTGAHAASTRVGAGLGGASRSSADVPGGSRTGGAPTIVFHGDADGTVHPNNGAGVIDAALRSAGATSDSAVATTVKSSAAGRAVTRTVHHRGAAASGEPSLAEHWVVHGAGHAWSGGSAAGSYTDARGPDASREMVRFFEEHPLRRA